MPYSRQEVRMPEYSSLIDAIMIMAGGYAAIAGSFLFLLGAYRLIGKAGKGRRR